MKMIVRALVAALTFLFQSPGPVFAQVQDIRNEVDFFDTGPLRIPEQFILGAGFLKLALESADVLTRGEWQADALQSITNNWTSSHPVEEFLEQEGRDRRTGGRLCGIHQLGRHRTPLRPVLDTLTP